VRLLLSIFKKTRGLHSLHFDVPKFSVFFWYFIRSPFSVEPLTYNFILFSELAVGPGPTILWYFVELDVGPGHPSFSQGSKKREKNLMEKYESLSVPVLTCTHTSIWDSSECWFSTTKEIYIVSSLMHSLRVYIVHKIHILCYNYIFKLVLIMYTLQCSCAQQISRKHVYFVNNCLHQLEHS